MNRIKEIKKCDNCNNNGLYILEMPNGKEKHSCSFCNHVSYPEPETFFYTEKVEIKEPEPQQAVKEPVKEVKAPEKKKGKK